MVYLKISDYIGKINNFRATPNTLLVLIFEDTNFWGDRIDHISRELIFADLPNQDISRVLTFADCRRKFPSKNPKKLKR